jgi:regulator of protease activity HflC (stomatin/prohibitin superfamily)
MLTAILMGLGLYLVVRCLVLGFFTVDQNERAVKTTFGRAPRLAPSLDPSLVETLRPDERERYAWPQLEIIPPGGPYFKFPWQKVHKVTIATRTVNMAYDPEEPLANRNGEMLEAVTKDQLNTGLTGELRYRVSERNLYAYLFGVKKPIVHTLGFFISVLRERIANFEAPPSVDVDDAGVKGVSINDLRKNLRILNEHMDIECASSEARYGILLDASLITGIDPPHEVESALAAINTAHNHVSSDVSLAQASADQKIVQSRTAVEIETLKAQAEVEPLKALAAQLTLLKAAGGAALEAYLRNQRLQLFTKANRVVLEVSK